MADKNQLLIKQLTAADFCAERHVRDLSATCVGSGELQQHRRTIERIAETTDAQLKNNVYEHYGQFIETARQIQYLEREMRQMSHQLTEQRQLMTQLLTHVPQTASAADPVSSTQNRENRQEGSVSDEDDQLEERRQQLLQLLDRMEGGGHVRDVPQRYLVLETELLAVTGEKAVGRVRGCLLSDSLLLAVWLAERRGAVRYRFQALFPLDTLALVNVRDAGSLAHTFKLLLPPADGEEGGVRVFQCPSAAVKQQWIDTVDAVKRRRLKLQQRELSARSKRLADEPNPREQETEMGEAKHEMEDDLFDDPVKRFPKWMSTAPEYLSELVVEQRFELAVDLVLKARQFLHQRVDEDNPKLQEFSRLIDAQRSQLLSELLSQLGAAAGSGVCCHESIVTRCLQLVERLGSAQRASRLLLSSRSLQLRHRLHQLRVSCSRQQVPRRLVLLVMTCLLTTVKQHCAAFADCQPNCLPALVVWVRAQVAQLVASFSRHVLSGGGAGVGLSAAAEGMSALHHHAAQLATLGLDVREQLSAGLSRHIARAISLARQQQLEAVHVRAAEDRWLPEERLPVELRHVQGAGSLTSNTLHFRVSFLQLVTDVATLDCRGAGGQQALADVMAAQLGHVQRACSSEQLRPVAVKNGVFLLNQVLPTACRQYSSLTGEDCSALLALRSSTKLPDIN